MIDHNALFVITGGPGSGKTSLIEALEEAGFARSVEAGRAVIQQQIANGGNALPWRDPPAFAEQMLAWDIQSYRRMQGHSGPVFFDRGIPDIIGYLRLLHLPVPEHMPKAAGEFRYNRRVFIAPPWREIYTQDTERKQDFNEAERTFEAMIETYSDLGYRLLELPRAAITVRLRFILDQISAGDGAD